MLNGQEIEKLSLVKNIKNRFNQNRQITKNNVLKNLADINIWKWYKPWNGKFDNFKFEEMDVASHLIIEIKVI